MKAGPQRKRTGTNAYIYKAVNQQIYIYIYIYKRTLFDKLPVFCFVFTTLNETR